MTAVMRAVSAVDEGPRMLRIAIVQHGRVVEERVVEDGAVTVGSAEDATFVLSGASRSFRLFERHGGAWRLGVTSRMSGRVALPTGLIDVAALAALGAPVTLDDRARGKIVVGDTTVLFQLVPPPPLRPRPRLPLAVTGGLADRVDWGLTIVAALSFLFHFGIVGAIYSDWLDPVVAGHDATLVDVSRVLRDDVPLDAHPPIEPGTSAPPNDRADAKEPRATAPSSKPAAAPTPTPSPSSSPGPRPAREAMSDERAAQLAAAADAMNMGMIVSLQGGPATKGALDRSEVPPVDMSSAAESSAAVAKGNGDLRLPSGGGTHVHAGDLSRLATSTKKDSGDDAGRQADTKPPIPLVSTQPPATTGAVSDADAVVAKLRPRFRKCYEDGLDGDPTMHGKAVLAARVGANGEVQSVEVVSSAGLSPKVSSCLAATLARAQFTASGASTVRVPVTFERQQP